MFSPSAIGLQVLDRFGWRQMLIVGHRSTIRPPDRELFRHQDSSLPVTCHGKCRTRASGVSCSSGERGSASAGTSRDHPRQSLRGDCDNGIPSSVVTCSHARTARRSRDWYRGIIEALDAGQSVAESFAPVERFLADATNRIRAGNQFMGEKPADLWTGQAAADASHWRRR